MSTEQMREALEAIELALRMNIPAAEILDENSPIRDGIRAALTALDPDALSQAARDVLAERQRQISAEGWTPEHDDEHSRGEMGRAAAAYALDTASQLSEHPGVSKHFALLATGIWPWNHASHKPADERRNLIKAGALILAEIERLDRAAMSSQSKEPT